MLTNLLLAALLGAVAITALPQRPIILTEHRPVPSNTDYRAGPPAANTRSKTPPGTSFNQGQFPSLTPTSNPSILYNPNGQNLTFVITAKDLPNTDLLDNIDPYIKVYSANKTHPEPEKFGTTDIIKDSPNAEFLNVFSSVWKKGQGQKWVLKVRDSDTLRDKSIGEAIIDVDDYVLKGEKVVATLQDAEGKPVNGTLLVQKTTPIKFKLYARNLPRSDPFNGKSDPFVKCYWKREKTGEAIKFFETKVHNDLENVDWEEVIEFANYIKGTNLWFVFKVYDSDSTGEDELGEAQVLIDPYVEKRQTLIADLIRDGKKGLATLGITPVSA